MHKTSIVFLLYTELYTILSLCSYTVTNSHLCIQWFCVCTLLWKAGRDTLSQFHRSFIIQYLQLSGKSEACASPTANRSSRPPSPRQIWCCSSLSPISCCNSLQVRDDQLRCSAMTQVKLISVKTVKQLRNMLACLGGKREKDEGSLLWYRLERRRYKCTCYVAVVHQLPHSCLYILLQKYRTW